MAKAVGTIAPIRIEKTLLKKFTIMDYSCFDTCASESEEMLAGANIPYRPNMNADKKSGNDYRDMAVSLHKLDDITEKIQVLKLTRTDGDVNQNESRTSCTINKVDNQKYLSPVRISANVSTEENSNHDEEEEEDEVNDYDEDYINDNKKCNMNIIDVVEKRRDSYSDKSEENDSDDSDLVERGPINDRPAYHHPYQPYQMQNRPPRSPRREQSPPLDYDMTAKQMLRDENIRDKLNFCLDQLSDMNKRSQESSSDLNATGTSDTLDTFDSLILNGSWVPGEKNGFDCTGASNDVSVPTIIVNNTEKGCLLEKLSRGCFQAAQVVSDTGSNSVSSPATRTWSDSPASNYNTVGSRSNSRSSSRAQSPGFMNLESPLMPVSQTSSSPQDSPQVVPTYRVPQGLSSSSSSNLSYGDTPSPSNYQTSLNQRIEEQLGEELDRFPTTWSNELDSSETIVNTDMDENFRLVEEVLLKNLESENQKTQMSPNSHCYSTDYEDPCALIRAFENGTSNVISCDYSSNVHTPSTMANGVGSQVCQENYNYVSTFSSKDVGGAERNQVPIYPPAGNHLGSAYVNYPQIMDDYAGSNAVNVSQNYGYKNLGLGNVSYNYPAPVVEPVIQRNSLQSVSRRSESDVSSVNRTEQLRLNVSAGQSEMHARGYGFPSSSQVLHDQHRKQNFGGTQAYPSATFNGFQIPEIVSSFKPTRTRRNSGRSIAPWPSLNLPSVRASERLKEGLDEKEVEKAMRDLLKKSLDDLDRADEDGDTELMCLVGNLEELKRKKAYLVPLVERLADKTGALSRKNKCGEDALYLAAMNCPSMPYVTGYLAAVMLRKGIDISQGLYHTRGDTLIHSVASRGDSHGEVLAELLALKTAQGHSVFDPSKCNYDRKTALHLAVESHNPAAGVKSVATVRLLLENGADPRIKEAKGGNTALHMAVSLGCDPALVKVLLGKTGSDVVNTTNYDDKTPLHLAAEVSNGISVERQKEVCWLLVHAGGQPNLRNKEGKTPLALVSADRKDAIKRIFQRK